VVHRTGAGAVVSGAWRADHHAAFVPIWIGFWCLTAIGLAELFNGEGAGRGREAAAAAVAVLLPLPELQRSPLVDTPAVPSVYGHEGMSSERLWSALRAMPEVTVIAEDASTDLLLGASAVERRTGKAVHIIGRHQDVALRARAAGRVFALPRAQAELQHRGVEFKPPPMRCRESRRSIACARALKSRDAGRVSKARSAQPDSRWSPKTPKPVARSRSILAATEPLQTPAVGWSSRALRGFQSRSYARADRPDLNDALRAQNIPADSALLSAAPYPPHHLVAHAGRACCPACRVEPAT
jgi:hypothetical protein